MSIKVNGKFVAGSKGEDGDPGKSAYEYAVDGGYTGTEEEFQALIGTGPWLPLAMSIRINPVYIFSYEIGIGEYVSYQGDEGNGLNPTPVYVYGIKFSKPIISNFVSDGSPISNVGEPVYLSDAATKKYVNDSIKSVKSLIKTSPTAVFKVNGPVAVGDTIQLKAVRDVDPYATIYFGQPIDLFGTSYRKFRVQIDTPPFLEPEMGIDGNLTNKVVITAKALDSIPDGESATIVWVTA